MQLNNRPRTHLRAETDAHKHREPVFVGGVVVGCWSGVYRALRGQIEADLVSVNMSHFPLSEAGMPPGPDLLLICGLPLSKPGSTRASMRHILQ